MDEEAGEQNPTGNQAKARSGQRCSPEHPFAEEGQRSQGASSRGGSKQEEEGLPDTQPAVGSARVASLLSCACLFMVKTPDIIGMTISLILVLVVFLVALVIKNRKGREAIGSADYLAIFSFSFSLSSSSVGIWIIMFSSLGMIHSVVNKRQSIPLIPFLFSAWCLAYAYY